MTIEKILEAGGPNTDKMDMETFIQLADLEKQEFDVMQNLIDTIQEDFESFVGYPLPTPQAMGHILKKNGYVTKATNGKTILKGYAFRTASTDKNQKQLA